MKKVYSKIWQTLDDYSLTFHTEPREKEDGLLVVIHKEGKYLSCAVVNEQATKEEVVLAVLEEHFRVLHRLDSLPKFDEYGLNKMQAVWYWASCNEWEKHLALLELFEHCLANDSIWHGYSAFNFGGALSGYNDDVVYGAIENGQRFMTFGDRWDRAAMWAKVHGYDAIAKAMDAIDELDDKTKRSVHVKAHDALVDAFWEVFKAEATREQKRDAMRYAFDK